MVRSLSNFTFMMLFLVHGVTFGQEKLPVSCLPEATALQSFEVWSSTGATQVYSLKSLRLGQIRETDVRVQIDPMVESGQIELSFFFKDPELMGLPFNLYAVMVVTSRGEVTWKDFTSSCVDPGVGFFPGQKFALPPISLDLKEGETYQVMVWGKM